MIQTTIFGELGQGNLFYLEKQGQEYEKIALKYIQEVFPWTPLHSMTNCRFHPMPFWTANPAHYMYLDNEQPVFVEEDEKEDK